MRPADLLLANLPYIPTATVPTLPVAASFEPAMALDGGDDGLDLVRRLIDQLPSRTAAEGFAMLEIGAGQELEIADYAAPGVARRCHDRPQRPGWTSARRGALREDLVMSRLLAAAEPARSRRRPRPFAVAR